MPDWVMPPGVPSTWQIADCEAHIRALASAGTAIEWSYHWQNRERDITTSQVLRVLRNGTIKNVSPAQAPHTGIKCVMHFVLEDGPTSVVVGLSDAYHAPTPYLTIITAF